MNDNQEKFQFDEGVKEILLALTAMAASSVGTYKAVKYLDSRPEPIEQKMAALNQADKEDLSPSFDKTVKDLKNYYSTKIKPKIDDTIHGIDVLTGPATKDYIGPSQPSPLRQRTNISQPKGKDIKSSPPEPKTDKSKPVLVKGKLTIPTPKKPQSMFSKNTGVGEDLVNFVKTQEGFKPNKHWDHKQWSIGHGSRAKPNETTITPEEADKRLREDLAKHKEAVLKAKAAWGYDWNDKQVDALTSFRFNIGSLGPLTQNGKRSNEEIAKKLLEYTKASGKDAPGLVKRRNFEAKMFASN
jgi:GH24 family phage-related lysozyme (muramidase)